LATHYAERVATLSLVSPRPMPELHSLQCPLLVLAGDQGPTAAAADKALVEVPRAASHRLRGYEYLIWSDVMADRGEEIAAAMSNFLDAHALPAVSLLEGEVAGITYRVRGSGPPLVLMPLDLTPSQWEPLIEPLSARYCTICLGGPLLGVVAILEARGRSDYLSVVRTVLDRADIKPGDVVLEVGGGSGVVLREIARRTAGSNRIIDVDINPLLLREAAALAKREGLAARMEFRQGSAETIPFDDASVDVALAITVLEEGDADRMLAELVRVTKPGGRIGAVVRALDLPWWSNLPLNPALHTKVTRPYSAAGAAQNGCAHASLYHRFAAAGLVETRFFPRLAAGTPETEPVRLALLESQIVAALEPAERAEWQEAAAAAKADGTFFIATGYHCAVGTKRV
jgi:SAM-dependent methyltransferase